MATKICKNKKKIRIFSWENILFFRAGRVVPFVCLYTLTGRVYKIHVKGRKSKNFIN
jgi:hypothetical protein